MNKSFTDLPMRQRIALQREADIATLKRDRELLDDRDHCVQRLNLHRDRWAAELAQDGFADTMRFYSLKEEEVQGLCIAFDRVCAQQSLRYLTDRVLTAPRAPSLEEQVELIRVEKTLSFRTSIDSPWWVKHMCLNREHFRGAAISTVDSSDTL
jgi:hypothetical protein